MDSRQLQLVLQLQDNASRELRKIAGELGNVEGATKSTSSMFGGFARNIAAAAAAFVSFRSAYNALNLGVSVAADMETAEVGIATLIGSTEKAAEVIKNIKTAAASTPFEITGLTQAVQLLTSVTKDGDAALDSILNIGEGLAAMGKGQNELNSIIVNLQQIANTGKISEIDIKQFGYAGINILELLATYYGTTKDAASEMIKESSDAFGDLVKAFDLAKDAGGPFFEAYKNQAGTFNQLTSNMSDSFGFMMEDIVKSSGIFDGLKTSMSSSIEVMQNWRGTVGDMRDNFVQALDLFDEKTLIITHIKIAFQNIVDTYNANLKPALAELASKLVELKPLWEAMAQVLGFVVVTGLHIVIEAVKLGVQWFTIMLTSLTEAANFIMTVFKAAVDWLSDAFIWIAEYGKDVAGGIDVVSDAISGLYDWFVKIIQKAERFIDLLSDMGGNAVDFVKSKFGGARAAGGPVSSSSAYLVGENGPELFKPNTNGTIIPNYAMAGTTPSGVNITIYGDVTGQEIVDKVGKALMDTINYRIRI